MDCPQCDGKGWYSIEEEDGTEAAIECRYCYGTGKKLLVEEEE